MTTDTDSRVADMRVRAYGDAAVLITGSDGAAAGSTWAWIHALADSLSDASLRGLEGIVATYDSLLIEYDPGVITRDELDHHVRTLLGPAAHSRSEGRIHRIPALYGGADGPDLEDVAEELNLSTQDFIDQHSAALWHVAFRGAPAGAPMLDGSPFKKPIARRSHPRIRVPAGSVAVSGMQGVVYPIDSPGGWRLIARTPCDVIDITRTPHLLYQPGDRFQFFPVTAADASKWRGALVGEST
ncbi:5-oxoprolinase subunit B family protein (plasmid) [Rhodococcoides fascians]|uniref:5-oxoprolinase subunit B family protein n=1 Tax=Rhodococcoides fascians TaxID=1828 RepID=UPI00389B2BF0